MKQGFNFHKWNNRINRMSLVFVVCHKDSTIIVAIELDDKIHEKASRQEADDKKDKALAATQIALARWKTNTLPDENTIKLVLAQNSEQEESCQTMQPEF